MEELNKVEKLAGHIKDYAETRFDLVVLSLEDKVTGVISSLVTSIVGAILTLFVLLFISIGGALWLGEYLQSTSIGFFCVAGFYLLLGLIVTINREKWIRIPMINGLIKKMNSHEEN